MQVNVDISKYPKVRFRAPFTTGTATMRIKIEVNTYERSPAQPLERVAFNVQSDWFTGSAEVLTFSTSELVATKIRALYQRSNLETKLTKPDFRNDLAPLIATTLDDYDPDMAARLVIDKLLTHIT